MSPIRHNPTNLVIASLVLVQTVLSAVALPVVRAVDPPTTTQPTTSAPVELRPPDEVLHGLSMPSAERQLEAFAAWHEWRMELAAEERPSADAYLSHVQWLAMLGNIAMHEMDGNRRRRAYEMLGRIGGQRVFPFMLWGLDESAHEGFFSKFLNSVDPGLTVRRFFRDQGDPTVLDHLPDWSWRDVRMAINDRWRDRPTPKKEWAFIDPEKFLSDLAHADPVRRRLAVRALTINPRYGQSLVARQFRLLLSDADRRVIHTVVKACEIVPMPSARGRLKALANDDSMSIDTRRACLNAIVRCGTARLWTAEWMIANIAEWPEEMDETVLTCLIELNRGKRSRRDRYAETLQEAAERIDDERTRSIVARALAEF